MDDKTSIERRHYLSTLTGVKATAQAMGVHWGIGNLLHWVLDVTFREDDSQIPSRHGAGGFNVFRQYSHQPAEKKKPRLSLKKKRYKAALNGHFRENVIIF